MPNIKQITLPSGTTYDIVDAGARELIEGLSGFTSYMGVTTTELTDGNTTNPIVINGENVTAMTGGIANYGKSEFIWNGTAWQEFGNLSALGELAYKDNAKAQYTPTGTVSKPAFNGTPSNVTITASSSVNGNYTPQGTVSKPTFTGTEATFLGTVTTTGSVSVSTKSTSNKTATVSKANSGTATYTPEGTVSAPQITVTPSTATVNSITAVGTLPEFTATVANEVLTLGFSQGSLPTKGSNQTVVTGIESATATQPEFTGTGARLVTGDIPVPSAYTATFTGGESSVSVTGTPSGTISQPTFSGTRVQLSGTTTAEGSVSQPTFSGTAATITAS